MATRYSKKVITVSILDGDEKRKYVISRLSAYEASCEGYKLIAAAIPSFGAAMEAFKEATDATFNPSSTSLTEMLFFLKENLGEEQVLILIDKLLGNMECNDKEIEDWSDHFDSHEGDFLEVLIKAFEGSFFTFFTKSTILAPWKGKMEAIIVQLKGTNEKL